MRILFTAFAVVLAGCGAPRYVIDIAHPPAEVHFTDLGNPAEDKALKQLTFALDRVMFTESMTELMGGTVTCGPFLWSALQQDAAATGLVATPAHYYTEVPGDSTILLEGAVIYSETDRRIFCGLLQRAFFRDTSAFTIRKPEFNETQLLWRHAAGTMSEPYFVIETGTGDLLVDMSITERAQRVPGDRTSLSGARLHYIDLLTGFNRFMQRHYPAGGPAYRLPKFFPQSPDPLENRKPRPRS